MNQPTLIFLTASVNFAKVFTETSLAKLKEIVRERLNFSAFSDFNLSYDITIEDTIVNIALETDDDFVAFQGHVQSLGQAGQARVHVVAAGGHRRTMSLGSTVLREDLVGYLYRIAQQHRFFLVRGTPGSGKTILCYQLFNHLLQIAPDDRVSCIKLWKTKSSVEESLVESCIRGDFKEFRDCYNDTSRRHWVLFDEAQTTYTDADLWATFLKELPDNFFVILFVSYGNQTSKDPALVGTPNNILPHLRMGLRPTQHGRPDDRYIPGLYFTLSEFKEVAGKRTQTQELPALDEDIAEWVFVTSGGHIGAIDSMLSCISSVAKITRPVTIGLSDFLRHFEGADRALHECSQGQSFDRGLPRPQTIPDPSHRKAIQFVRQLLEWGGRTFPASSVPEGARLAHRQGWVTLEEDDETLGENEQSTTTIDFPSPFHLSRFSYLLQGSYALPHAVEQMDLPQFINEVVKSFSSNALRHPERHITGSQAKPSIPEAQWQQEVYRGAYKVTQGRGMWISPEFGTSDNSTKAGRIDFYVMGSKKWGIEVLREGDRLEEHLSRFAPGGAYNVWIANGQMLEYVVLDFRAKSKPRKKILNQPLFHITFGPDFETYSIQDCQCTTIFTGTLLA
ncbi:hypothetical protein C8R44DRAFT_977950 [Mycena epipterygia]|nr:hypothetical protein C8R44DRAFT_977950 [Mycena epipterygia]